MSAPAALRAVPPLWLLLLLVAVAAAVAVCCRLLPLAAVCWGGSSATAATVGLQTTNRTHRFKVLGVLPSDNDLLDPDLLPRPQFAHAPRLRSLLVPRRGKVFVRKRDARHYFHMLVASRAWRKFLGMPPVKDSQSGILS